MPITETVRLNLHRGGDPLRVHWSLLLIITSSNGVPHARLVDHGVVDLQDPDPVGIGAVAALLARATAPTV